MAKKKLGAAVIGLRMGDYHLVGYRKNPNTEIVAICDTDPVILEEKKKQYEVPVAVKDYRELLDNKDIDIVSVVTPDYYHAEQSIAFMEAGKDILCDKPMTPTVEEAKEIMKAVKKTGRKFMIGQVCRYSPAFAFTKKLVDRGELGELFFVESEYAHDYSGVPGVGNWRVDPRREPFLGGGCHAVDFVRWVAGEAQEVFAYANHKCLTTWPVNDCTVALYKFAGNIIGKVFVSVGCIRPYTMRSVFYGVDGTIVCDNRSPYIEMCRKGYFGKKQTFMTVPIEVADHNVSDEISDFVDCLLNNKPVPMDAAEGARTVVAALSAARSAREGKPVKIEQIK
ncbi:MAG TPA: Gfo/Idh/MocA family oxidoreductase [bacterium]|nr:Gfo/Idh/MocA family oxidoreductase [bacterium]